MKSQYVFVCALDFICDDAMVVCAIVIKAIKDVRGQLQNKPNILFMTFLLPQ